MSRDETALHLPAQNIPPPSSLSAAAQAWLVAAARRIASAPADGPDSSERMAQSAAAAVAFLRPMARGFKGSFETIMLDGAAPLYRATPEGRRGRAAEVAYFDIHGGGFVTGGGEMCQLLTRLRAIDYGAEVFSVDYRLCPDHPYPAALDDCMAAYREILGRYDAGSLVVGGSSAGGNLAAALMLRARDEGLPLPAGLVLLTPGVDITRSGDSHQTNRFLDVNLHGGADAISSYSGGEDPTHPYVSPLFGDFSSGWPSTFLMTGTRDLFLSDTVRMHAALRRAGVSADLYVTEAAPHGGFMGAGAPEDTDAVAQCRRFVRSAWGIDD
jgi:acetyl esterase/lipase